MSENQKRLDDMKLEDFKIESSHSEWDKALYKKAEEWKSLAGELFKFTNEWLEDHNGPTSNCNKPQPCEYCEKVRAARNIIKKAREMGLK